MLAPHLGENIDEANFKLFCCVFEGIEGIEGIFQNITSRHSFRVLDC